MTTCPEMPIPRALGETIPLFVITIIVVFFTILAVFDLLSQEAVVAPILWLGIVIYGIWEQIKTEGGFHKFVISWLDALAGRRFAEIAPPGDLPNEIQFGFRLFGRRYVRRSISLDKVISVEWSPGQATGLAGRDMKCPSPDS